MKTGTGTVDGASPRIHLPNWQGCQHLAALADMTTTSKHYKSGKIANTAKAAKFFDSAVATRLRHIDGGFNPRNLNSGKQKL